VAEVGADTVVDGRYRIKGRVGSGGMADVYLAEDTQLGRDVALKILHRRFAQDREFVERFRREASSAAGLQHPNVVGVFDRGEHDGTYYIAMAHLPGRTLKDIVAAEAPLGQERVIDLGTQILQAAAFAHSRGVIHRDFKPHNVIVDDLGRAQVTDFGIARAGASEITEAGSIMGTAQYLSPEQAQGHEVTAATDIYSIGITLYELLAGRLPFDGDRAVSIALKHMNEPPPPLSELRPDVHPALEAVVMHALAKDPAQRWSSAEEMITALETARAQVAAGPVGQDTAEHPLLPAPVPVEGDDEDEKGRRWPKFALALLVLALIAVVVYACSRPEQIEVPRAETLQLDQARERLERDDFEVKVTRRRSLAKFDRVLDQDPEPGDEADKGSPVTLEVSDGPGDVRIPSVEGLPQARAAKELAKEDLKANIDTVPSDSVKRGVAIKTVPRAGTEVERGSRVRLFVSAGPRQVSVPDVVGLTQSSAEARLESEGLSAQVERQASSEPEDEVISQDPGTGARLARGDRVTIVVSEGPRQVTVPDVVGLSASAASARLRSAGFGVSRRERSVTDRGQDGEVLDQSPSGGTQVDEGRSVVIFVGAFDEPSGGGVPPDSPPVVPPEQ
jgi:serine/threonine-protein kinase